MFGAILGQVAGALIGGIAGRSSGGGASSAVMDKIMSEIARRSGIESDVIAQIKNARNTARINARARMADLEGVLADSQQDRAKSLGAGFATAGYRETDSPIMNAMSNAQRAFDNERLQLADSLYTQELQNEMGMAQGILGATQISAQNLSALGGAQQAAAAQDSQRAQNTAAFASIGQEIASGVDWNRVFKRR